MSKRKTHEEFIEELKSKNKNYRDGKFVLINQYKTRKTRITCQCSLHNHIWDASVFSLLNGCECQVCNNEVVVKGQNDFQTTHPNIAKMLKDKKVGRCHTYGSTYKTDWICPNCGNIISNKAITTVVRDGFSCPICSDGISYPEKILYFILKNNDIYFTYQFQPDWIKPKKI